MLKGFKSPGQRFFIPVPFLAQTGIIVPIVASNELWRRLDELRREKGLSIAEMCQSAGLERSRFKSMRKARTVNVEAVREIAKVVEMPVEELDVHLAGVPLRARLIEDSGRAEVVRLYEDVSVDDRPEYLAAIRPISRIFARRGRPNTAPQQFRKRG